MITCYDSINDSDSDSLWLSHVAACLPLSMRNWLVFCEHVVTTLRVLTIKFVTLLRIGYFCYTIDLWFERISSNIRLRTT